MKVRDKRDGRVYEAITETPTAYGVRKKKNEMNNIMDAYVPKEHAEIVEEETCWRCGGDGETVVNGKSEQVCPSCHGAKVLPKHKAPPPDDLTECLDVIRDMKDAMVIYRKVRCNAGDFKYPEKCPECIEKHGGCTCYKVIKQATTLLKKHGRDKG